MFSPLFNVSVSMVEVYHRAIPKNMEDYLISCTFSHNFITPFKFLLDTASALYKIALNPKKHSPVQFYHLLLRTVSLNNHIVQLLLDCHIGRCKIFLNFIQVFRGHLAVQLLFQRFIKHIARNRARKGFQKQSFHLYLWQHRTIELSPKQKSVQPQKVRRIPKSAYEANIIFIFAIFFCNPRYRILWKRSCSLTTAKNVQPWRVQRISHAHGV